ncbi:MAG: hypothetical protein NTV52_16625 [Acidobacteria bacterium]|nr:hypothetical protein [Acidobacteriota bacterium]
MQKPSLVIIGSGGHAKVIVEIFEETAAFDIAGYTSLSSALPLFHYPYLGDDDALPAILASGVTHAFPAIGSNRIRYRMPQRHQSPRRRLPPHDARLRHRHHARRGR